MRTLEASPSGLSNFTVEKKENGRALLLKWSEPSQPNGMIKVIFILTLHLIKKEKGNVSYLIKIFLLKRTRSNALYFKIRQKSYVSTRHSVSTLACGYIKISINIPVLPHDCKCSSTVNQIVHLMYRRLRMKAHNVTWRTLDIAKMRFYKTWVWQNVVLTFGTSFSSVISTDCKPLTARFATGGVYLEFFLKWFSLELACNKLCASPWSPAMKLVNEQI